MYKQTERKRLERAIKKMRADSARRKKAERQRQVESIRRSVKILSQFFKDRRYRIRDHRTTSDGCDV